MSTYEKILKHVSKVTDITDEKLKNVMKKMVSEKLILKTVKRFGL